MVIINEENELRMITDDGVHHVIRWSIAGGNTWLVTQLTTNQTHSDDLLTAFLSLVEKKDKEVVPLCASAQSLISNKGKYPFPLKKIDEHLCQKFFLQTKK